MKFFHNFFRNNSNLYITAWCLYYLQGTLYASGSLLSQALMFLIIIVSLYYFKYANEKYRIPSVLKTLNILLIFFTIYGIIIIIFGNGISGVVNYRYLKGIYMSLLPIYPFYVFTKKGELTEDSLRYWVLLFIPIAIASFYRDQRESLMAAIEMGSRREEFTLNAAYIFLAIIPLLALCKKAVVQYTLLAVCLYFVLMGVKRGALLTGAICLLYFIMSSFKQSNKTKKIWVLILSVGLIVLAYNAIIYMMETSDYFNSRLEQTQDGNSSGRDVIFNTLWNYFLNSNIIYFLIGHGADATLKVTGYAHNDWLEIAVNNGLLGVIIYLAYWINMYKLSRKTSNDVLKKIITLFIIVYFTRTFYSMSYNDIPIYATSALGFALAKSDMKSLNNY